LIVNDLEKYCLHYYLLINKVIFQVKDYLKLVQISQDGLECSDGITIKQMISYLSDRYYIQVSDNLYVFVSRIIQI